MTKMKIAFIGNSGTYKTTVANHLWAGTLWYYPPTVNYQIIPYGNHTIYDCSGDYSSIPCGAIDIFVLFTDNALRKKALSDELWYKIIRKENHNARIVGVVSPTSLTECVSVAEELKRLLY